MKLFSRILEKTICYSLCGLLAFSTTCPAQGGFVTKYETDDAVTTVAVNYRGEASDNLSALTGEAIIVTFKEDVSGTDQHRLLEETGFATEYLDEDFAIGCVEGKSSLDSLAASPLVLNIERDTELQLCSLTDDPYSGTQWWLENTGTFDKVDTSTGDIFTINCEPDIDIDAEEGWRLYKSLIGNTHVVTVAIIDTGIDYQHPDLADAMWINEGEIPDNGIDDDNNGYVDDVYGWDFYNDDNTVCHYTVNETGALQADPDDPDNHGTHIAGAIIARANNQVGLTGIARYLHTNVMSLKIHGGPDRKGTISDAVKAIKYAQANGASVCNISWGSYSRSSSLETAIARSPMLFVCAAGNESNDNDINPLYPASLGFDNVISTTYVDCDGRLSWEASYGAETVDIAAPSSDIFSTTVGSYGYMTGSSMAAPQISAVAAVLFSLKQGITPASVKQVITTHVKKLDSLEGKCISGGMLDLRYCLEHRDELVVDREVPTFSWSQGYINDEIELTFEPDDGDGSGFCAMKYLIGKRGDEDFVRGTEGTTINDNSLTLAKAGNYTFYIYDKAGNGKARTIRIFDDKIPPIISKLGFTVNAKHNKFTVTALVSDAQSGLRSVKYLPGKHAAADFLSSGTSLKPDSDGMVSFKTKTPGLYTILATDFRGNKTLKTVRTFVRAAKSISISDDTLTLSVGDSFLLSTTLLPKLSTDRVTFTSGDEDVVAVTVNGKVTARGRGKTTITATTDSGLKAVCNVTVSNPG